MLKNVLNTEEFSLKGPVHSVSEISYTAKTSFGKIEKGERKRESHCDIDLIFNSDGFLVEKSSYDSSGKIISKWKINYEKDNKISEKIHYDSKGNIQGHWEYIYDEKGRKSEKIWQSALSNLNKKILSSYNENNQVVEQKIFNFNKDYDVLLLFSYNQNGFRTEKKVYNANGKINSRYAYKYNEDNKLAEVSRYDFNSKINEKESYVYDEKGLMIRKYINNYKSFLYDFIYNYDANNNLTEMRWIEEGSNLVKNGMSKYAYDNFGNWIERIDYQNDIPMFIIERTIKYYK